MSTHKAIDRICVAVTLLSLLLTVLLFNGEALGLTAASRSMGYEKTLFDTSRVHTIDIVIDDWDAFLETATSEEYALCSVVIDNEAVKNVAIRGKGNTSLSSVATMDSERYSFKLEFDHYETGKTYKGLDKLCLNNLIQDNSYLKDYLAYTLMAEYGVDTPLCSFVYLTVNGEDWGLYLAVEAVEDSFLQRVYGGQGDLYKPDSLSMGGGGPGNGMNFNFEDFINENAEAMGFPWSRGDEGENTEAAPEAAPAENSGEASSMGGDEASSAGGGSRPQMPNRSSDETNSMGGGQMTPPGFQGGNAMPDGSEQAEMPEGFGGEMPDMGGGFGGGMPGGIGMGSSDVKLQYTDDDPESYSNIFSNAKTDVTNADQTRLIRALQALSEGEDLEDVLDIDELLRYFVVHNYLVNNDSYTGAMVHNYYLHEDDGQLSMIPWDYNLAYGTFQAGDASGAVNDPIDSPLSVSGDGSRPMADWIFRSEEYTELYHQYFAEFLETVDISAIIDEAYALIAPYVEKDPTAFCSYEEFEAGVAALRSFCEKRSESVRGQLEGTIPSTDEGQQADSSALIDATGLTLSDMGSMGGGGGGGFGGDFAGQQSGQGFSFPGGGFGGDGDANGASSAPSDGGGFSMPQTQGGLPTQEDDTDRPSPPDGFSPGGMPDMSFGQQSGSAAISWPPLILSAVVLAGGLAIGLMYRRRR